MEYLEQNRRGVWIGHVAAGMYVVSMFLPALNDLTPPPLGYRVAYACLAGLPALDSMALFGTAANVLFVGNYALFIVRSRRGTDGCSKGTRALAAAGAVTPPLSVILMLPNMGPGFYVWWGAAIVLTVGTYLLRVPKRGSPTPRGFEVVIKDADARQ